MCYYELNEFTGCGCIKHDAEAILEKCPIAQAYSRVCPEFQCGPDPRKQPTERFGLVCMECLEGKTGKADSGANQRWASVTLI
ncbi:hypothetical protein VP1G_02062 [Cytospora mali]|uniref:Uncharacterized protein n=1 Tax=Cytospora mali TaxID=578113 RepID=A0A194USY3_CYTMA|nr:hypothetical protein VP1G_02062 [Valsa mali var. pyri (nom. inval.)]